MKTVTRDNLEQAVYARTDCINQAQTRDLVQQTLHTMSDALAAGEDVKIHEFGHFRVQHKKERIGRNPKRPDNQYVVPPLRRVALRFSDKVKALVEKGLHR